MNLIHLRHAAYLILLLLFVIGLAVEWGRFRKEARGSWIVTAALALCMLLAAGAIYVTGYFW